ncbi:MULTISPECIES: nuclear transport factor 2 family protein [Sulfitobacter]|uniref:Nuclear transport factor 2 family protein n=1 Tax=Sulfitobacter profundi TaxID=2679961 RepID=A0ABW1Z3K6_9RHOB|nr:MULTISPECIES: nuclear transport factor 2 family protein [Sulfitobacter]UWR36362.1 nuclear transport factor 2 family protein [Sulfitobacter sp. W074]
MSYITGAKGIVRAFHTALDSAPLDGITQALSDHCSSNYRWRGYHPFNELTGPAQVADTFWRPLRRSLTHMQRREDIFFAGVNSLAEDSSVWVVSMGHLMGLFDEPWLEIVPTRKITSLRYCEFSRVDQGQIIESAMYFDIPHLMIQAGLAPFPGQTGAHLVQPGPQPHNGLLLDPQNPNEGRRTLDLINRMISDLGQWNSGLSLRDELAQTWAEDMLWWGPAGIGATYTIDRYMEQHSAPFRAGFAERSKTQHVCRLAEGHFGGFFGWPNFTARPTGGFMGYPGGSEAGEFRVIDIYRRDHDKLAENWVFIDLPHFWKSQGYDILGSALGMAPSRQ